MFSVVHFFVKEYRKEVSLSGQSKIVLLNGQVVRFEHFIPQGHRDPKRVLLIVRNSNETFTCTTPRIGFMGGTDTSSDLASALRKVGVAPDFLSRMVAFFNATGLTRASVEHEFPHFEVQSDETASDNPKQMTLGF